MGNGAMLEGWSLLALWMSSGVRLNPPASPADVTAFERRHNVRVPRGLRELLLNADGAVDANGFRFLSLDEYDAETARFFRKGLATTARIFVVHRPWSTGYAIEMGECDHGSVHVVAESEDVAKRVAVSVESFLFLVQHAPGRLRARVSPTPA